MRVNMEMLIQDGDSGRKFEKYLNEKAQNAAKIWILLIFFNFQKLSNDTNQIKEILGVHKWQVGFGIHDIAGKFSWNLRQSCTLRLFPECESFLLNA